MKYRGDEDFHTRTRCYPQSRVENIPYAVNFCSSGSGASLFDRGDLDLLEGVLMDADGF